MVDGELGSEPIARPDADGGARGRFGGDLDDGDALAGVLLDATGERQLELAPAGVLPELAGLPEREVAYARAARAANTLRGYRSDWADFTTWCTAHDAEPMPATHAALTGYLVALAEAGAKVGTLARRLSSIKFHIGGCGTVPLRRGSVSAHFYSKNPRTSEPPAGATERATSAVTTRSHRRPQSWAQPASRTPLGPHLVRKNFESDRHHPTLANGKRALERHFQPNRPWSKRSTTCSAASPAEVILRELPTPTVAVRRAP
ncbi:MAG: site-specific integrase [Quadrisphaera sp.]